MKQIETNVSEQDCSTIHILGSTANDRYHNLTGNGAIEGGTSTAGNICNRLLCRRGVLSGDRCDDRILNSTMPVPAAITMVRVGAGQAANVRANYTFWRGVESEHSAPIGWGYSTGWGELGEIRFKVMKCSSIPREFGQGTKYVQADYVTPQGDNFIDLNIKQWQAMVGLCPPALWEAGPNGTYGCGLPKPAAPLCFHGEDKEDHKCFEACNAEGKKFATKGIEATGNCPANYNTVDTTKTVLQCPDGVTNVRYCAASALNVTIATKGEQNWLNPIAA